jgi:hypothetical protein
MWKDKSIEQAWDEEVARRMADLKAGKVVTVPWEQLHRELLALVMSPKRVDYYIGIDFLRASASPR